MKVVVVGGTGLIGSKVVAILGEYGHDAIPASPNTGVDTLTGKGLAEVLVGVDVVVDVSNSPSFEDSAVLDFFTRASTNLLAAESAAGVCHHVVLSVVGNDRLPDSGYMRAKFAQERLISESDIPYSIVRATQFFEFFEPIASGATSGSEVRLTSASIQPVASLDVAREVARVSVGAPLNGTVEIGGPEVFTMADFVARGLTARADPRTVVVDDGMHYFGALLADRELLAAGDARRGKTTFDAWLAVDVVGDPKP